MERVERTIKTGGGSHFLAPSTGLTFVKTGSTMLNLVIGGGWPLGRIANIVGDKSTGKTLLAIEAFANFNRQWERRDNEEVPEQFQLPGSRMRMWYRESEHAFDQDYARAIGMPVEKIKFWDNSKRRFSTVEDFFEDLEKQANWAIQKNASGIYVLDSLDALTDRTEAARAIDAKSYGGDKARQMSELFRRLSGVVEEARIQLLIISQVRANIGVKFGRKYARTGGKAMDFYCSQVVYLANTGIDFKTKKGQKRAVGIDVIARCEKNKVGLPFRQCYFPIRFAFGIEDLQSCVSYLKECKKLERAGIDKKLCKTVMNEVDSLDDDEYRKLLRRSRKASGKFWRETETSFLPARTKYDNDYE